MPKIRRALISQDKEDIYPRHFFLDEEYLPKKVQSNLNVKNKNSIYFFEWIPKLKKSSICNIQPKRLNITLT